MTHKINHADIKEWAANYDGEPFDAILCDPPYELGFMGKSWDSTGIAFDTDLWKDLLRICKPGAHLLAFSGSRTYHRMAVAIEDAGFEIRDMIEWVYGSGFPKSLNIGKAVDKIQGNERQVVGSYKGAVQNPNSVAGGLNASPGADENGRTTVIATKGNSPFEGYGTALKPAHEPCVLARKPLDGTVANNVLKHGTGGLAIDATRIPTTETWKNAAQDIRGGNLMGKAGRHPNLIKESNSLGRFPSNLILDGSDEVEAVFPQTKSPAPYIQQTKVNGDVYELGSLNNKQGKLSTHHGDSGSASRFFYCAKSSKSERNAGLEGFEVKEVRGGGGRVESGYDESTQHLKESARKYGAVKSAKANIHPTVKPLALTKYLANLIKPPTGGRLLVPFSGSGSEMIGALQAGWEYVEGVELTEEYIPIAEARIKYWLNKVEEESKQGVLL